MDKAGTDLVLAPKRGFTIPIDKWLRENIKEEVNEKIMNMPANLSVLFRKRKLQELLRRHTDGLQNSGWFIWALYSLVQWDSFHRHKYN
jgi:asparagine synthase (glutamine-hydrolysing)